VSRICALVKTQLKQVRGAGDQPFCAVEMKATSTDKEVTEESMNGK